LTDYEIIIGDQNERIGVSEVARNPEKYEFKRGNTGKLITMTVLNRGSSRLILSIENKVYSVFQISRSPDKIEFLMNGELVIAHHPIKTLSRNVSSGITFDKDLVVSNFPAKVVSVLVTKDSHVREGETLMVLEAMKMEAQIKAQGNCIVLETFVKEGEVVARGAKLARLKFN
jgi:oxaloacetate decarboxylase alpha subunit